jgi:hypothetical protein
MIARAHRSERRCDLACAVFENPLIQTRFALARYVLIMRRNYL